MSINPIFQRLTLLLGEEPLHHLRDSRAFVFGLGGVGSWCAEGLVRSGIGTIVIVDSDTVCVRAGVTVARDINGAIRTYGLRSLADPVTDPDWVQFPGSRLMMAIYAKALAVAEDKQFPEIDGQAGRQISKYIQDAEI